MYADPSEKNVCNFGTDLVSLTIDSTKKSEVFFKLHKYVSFDT